MAFEIVKVFAVALFFFHGIGRCEKDIFQQRSLFDIETPKEVVEEKSLFSNIINLIIPREKNMLIKRFPYMCSIRERGSRNYVCSGFLINQQWVVTAAHCVDPKVQLFGLDPLIYFGDYGEYGWDEEELFVAEGFMHPRWTGDYKEGFDIALLKLNKTTNLRLPDINKHRVSPLPGTLFTTLDWRLLAPGNGSHELQISMGLPYIEREACQKLVDFKVKSHMICIFKTRIVCRGHSGR